MKSIEKEDIARNTQPVIFNQNTLFPQIHTNLNGMVSEFVRTMYQDKKGNYWFGTNGNGIFKYNEGEFTHLTNKNGLTDNNAADILEDNKGQLWFGTWLGISLYDGETFMNASDKEPWTK